MQISRASKVICSSLTFSGFTITWKEEADWSPLAFSQARHLPTSITAPEQWLKNICRDDLPLFCDGQVLTVTADPQERYERDRYVAYRADGSYYDIFNSAVGLDSAGRIQLHHKGRLVIGVENTPTWVFDVLRFLVIDLGGTLGQIGMGQHGTALSTPDEGRAGNLLRRALRQLLRRIRTRGSQSLLISSNDGWWGDTPGHKHLFSIARLRAVEHRRAIARSANTGTSGFIDTRGDVQQKLGWDRRGILTGEVELNSELTFYTRYGDYVARIAEYVLLLSLLYYVAYRIKRKNYLVQ